MEQKEKLKVLNDAYALCIERGRVKNRKEFADLLGVHRTTLSSAFNGDEKYLTDKLNELKLTQPHITDVRGRGLMIGIQLDMPYKEIRSRLVYEHNCFVGCSGTDTLRLLPPLCLTEAEADCFVEKLKTVLS